MGILGGWLFLMSEVPLYTRPILKGVFVWLEQVRRAGRDRDLRGDPHPGLIRNPKPETLNPKPEARNPKPETLNLKPETLNPKS